MPQCYKCNMPIIFAREKPEFKVIGSYNNPSEILTDPKPFPININPDNANGTVALYESSFPAAAAPTIFARRLYHEAAKMYLRAGGALYTSHFETCPARR